MREDSGRRGTRRRHSIRHLEGAVVGKNTVYTDSYMFERRLRSPITNTAVVADYKTKALRLGLRPSRNQLVDQVHSEIDCSKAKKIVGLGALPVAPPPAS
ncbi:hypothetical protein MAPG_03907 [Magnaporthiopsis poae ATCC 64411]|uniref:Uncharacterized protein n=1 Tax=Magnaporthiopsis poae (strain ATCC 64411 / 73-15) TaxID=644358 RepID=A0A0C4DVA5_MAGP6|nr:hypothetical protein MAPG_03907 [Magnaporthiopsis poae ATCC 64411]